MIAASDIEFKLEDQVPSFEKKQKDHQAITFECSDDTKDFFLRLADKDRLAVKELIQQSVLNRRLVRYAVSFFMVFALLIVGLVAASIQVLKETKLNYDTHVSTYDGSNAAIYSSGCEITDINSDSSHDEIGKIERINFVLGSGKNITTFSLKPTGFSTMLCDHDCNSANVLYMYTSEGVLVYHGKEMYIANPSENILLALNRHDVPSSKSSRRLFYGVILRALPTAAKYGYRAYTVINNVNKVNNAYQYYQNSNQQQQQSQTYKPYNYYNY